MKKKLLLKSMLLLCALIVGGNAWAVDDTIDNAATSSNTGNTATSAWVTDFSIIGTSGATYYIHTMGTKSTSNALQWNKNGYLYATASGGTLKSVTITGTPGKDIYVYAANSAYSAAPSGTALTTMSLTGSAVTYTFTGTYTYIALKGNASSTSITSIVITYEDPNKVATPSFNPAAGTYNETKSVTLSCNTDGASIRYTTNGDTPTSSSTLYEGAISVTQTTIIKAKAFKTGLDDSDEASATYTLKCATPTITKADGDFVTTKEITMTSSAGATIRYTTDGSTEPTTSVGTVYDPDNKPSISATTTIKAIAYKDGWTSSDVATQLFEKGEVLDGMTALVAKTNTSAQDYYVDLDDAQVTWTNGARLGYIEDAARGAYWSSNNDANSPTKNKVYNGIFKVSYQYSNYMPTVKSMTAVEGTITDGNDLAPTVMTPSALDAAFTTNLGRQIQINNFTVATGKMLTENIALYGTSPYVNVTVGHTYTLVGYPYQSGSSTKQFRVVTAVEAPTFSPEEGIFYDAFNLTLSCATAGATIYYTTDGSTPTTSSTQYSSAFEVPAATTTVKAIAVKNGAASNVAEATYTYYAVKLPTFVTASPVYYNDKAEVTCETDGATFYYTLTTDGSEPADPTDASNAYSDGIAITANTVKIKVIAKKGNDYSLVASATYTLNAPEAPIATPGASIVEPESTVALSSPRDGTTIYYTLDETEPDDNSTPYTAAITIDADKTIKAVAYDGAGNKGAVLTAAYQIYTDATFSVADMTIEIGEQKSPVVTTDSEGTVTFTSGNTAIATIVDGKINAVAKGPVTITANITASGTKRAATTTFTVTVKNPAVWETTSKGIDELTYSTIGFTGEDATVTYTNFSNVSSTSAARYAGQAARQSGLGYIQIRTKNSNSGIVTTTSGGKARKVVVDWNTSTGNGRYVSIYGKNEAYTAATDLFDSEKYGELLGTIVKNTSTELTIEGDYQFIGIKASDALYMNSVKIYWEGDAVTLSDASDYTPVAKDYAKVTLNRKFVEGWNGIILPFDLTTSVKTALGASDVKTLGSATEDAGAVTLNFTDALLPVDAGTPVLVKLAAVQESGDVVLNGVELKTTTPTTVAKTVAGNTFTLTGTYSSADLVSAEAYFVSNNTFYHKAAGVALTAKPFRSYIVQTADAGARMLNVNFDLEDGEAAGIVEMNANVNRNNSYYDMQGRRVAQPRRGLYIVNGKKVLVK